MTEFIISRVDGNTSQVLGTVQADGFTEGWHKAFEKWYLKPTQSFLVMRGTPAEIRFARDMEVNGICSDMDFEESMKLWLGETEGAR